MNSCIRQSVQIRLNASPLLHKRHSNPKLCLRAFGSDTNSDYLNSLYQTAKAKLEIVPSGLKQFYAETKEVYSCIRKKGSGSEYRTRREHQMVMKYGKDFSVVLGTGIIFCIPGGSLLVLMQLGYPKTMTTHFWTDEQWHDFQLERYRAMMKHKVESDLSDMINLGIYHNVIPGIVLKLKRILPSSIIKNFVTGKINFLLEDDHQILKENFESKAKEDNIDAMTHRELWDIVINRGIDTEILSKMHHLKDVPHEHLRESIRAWIKRDKCERRKMLQCQ